MPGGVAGAQLIWLPPMPIAPSMGALLRVQVPPYVAHSERSEAQLHESDRGWGTPRRSPVSHDLNFSNRPVRTRLRGVWQGGAV